MSYIVQKLIAQLRSPKYREQELAADELAKWADPAAELPLLVSFSGGTYRLIDEDGHPARYYAILSSAARALAILDTDRAFDALVTKIRSNPRMDQLGVAAAVYGLSFSPRPSTGEIIRSITPRPDEDCGGFLARQIADALERVRTRTTDAET